MSLSNYPTIRPSLVLDFQKAEVVDPRITFTRASTATRYNSYGLLETVGNNVPRIDFDPTTLVCNGLLVEESRTNLFVQSEDFSTSWSTLNAAIVSNSTVAPNGTTTADTFNVTDASNVTKRIDQVLSPIPSGANVFSVYVKAGTQNFVQLLGTGDAQAFANFDVSAGTVGTVGTKTTASIQNVGNGWYRCIAAFNSSTVYTGGTFRIAMATNASAVYGGTTPNTGTFFLWGAQFEAGAFPTSYIPTVAATVTRQADVASMTGTNFSSWYNAAAGTVVWSASTATPDAGSPIIFTISDGSNENRIAQFISSNLITRLRAFNTTYDPAAVGSAVTANTQVKGGVAYATNSAAATLRGVTPTTSSTVVVPAVTRLSIGYGAAVASLVNGTIQRISYYPARLTNAQLQALTAT